MVKRVPVILPQWGSVDVALIVTWLRQCGDMVVQDEPVVDVETEKSVVSVNAPVSGTLIDIITNPDDEVRAGQVLAYIETLDPSDDV